MQTEEQKTGEAWERGYDIIACVTVRLTVKSWDSR